MSGKRINPRIVVFLLILVGAFVWIGSGVLTRAPPQLPVGEERPPPVVAASWSAAQPIERRLTLYGEVEPSQIVRLRAQTAGQIAEILTSRGAIVTPGVILARLAIDDRMARLRRAEARLAETERDYEATQDLFDRDIAPKARLSAALAELEAARADLQTIQVEIENTELRAPMEGVVNRLLAERGDFVGIGSEVVEIVDNDPLRAVVHVPQHAIGRVEIGTPAQVALVGREPVEGRVQFVSPLADAATRTFRVEIEVPNAERRLPSGISAEVLIPTETVMAHRISPALVGLDDQGRTGAYAVDESGVVVVHPLRLVRAEPDGIWVAGLPERAQLITIRPGFVMPGQRVEVQDTPDAYRPIFGAGEEGPSGP